ncbi:hypothetical protein ABID21_002271 [Pseudorhizobium tarimense]|uniref:J domain-containing protein n=1 Tax=Pseudorhizobium tarimense TaxID=1079109 RepID=A0ABV2H6H9_9HYPH|nr:hypothetical protein [Pseudorhizobium tarimense]MCJ8519501.1 hypothetical protein [Pseudorhizobium tarimense]
MLLGQSVFQSVLTRLDEEKQEDEPPAEGAVFRVPGLTSGFVAATKETVAFGSSGAGDAYLEMLADKPPPEPDPPAEAPRKEPFVPEHLLRISDAEIAEDLALTPDETAETLAEKRRRFAKDNHPDRVPEALRDNATLRMKTANILIDRAIRDLYWCSS